MAMAREYAAPACVLHLLWNKRRWTIEFYGRQCRSWRIPDAAVIATARHNPGFWESDRKRLAVPDDLLGWRSLNDSL